MKVLNVAEVTEALVGLCEKVNVDLPPDVEGALREALDKEVSPFGQTCLRQIVDNVALARSQSQAMCQDTGAAVVYLEIGQDLHLVGGDINEAVHEGIRQGYTQAYLRKSMVQEPVFDRVNTGDNSPAIIHTTIVPGHDLTLTLMPKGGGAENMGALAMLKPTAGPQAVIDFAVETVSKAGGNPCPPIVVGIGLGGTLEKAALLAKDALRREMGSRHPDPRYADLEKAILEKVNDLGIGPQGLGGKVTALAVHIETYPTHIATMPMVVNLNCHAARHESLVLKGRDSDD